MAGVCIALALDLIGASQKKRSWVLSNLLLPDLSVLSFIRDQSPNEAFQYPVWPEANYEGRKDLITLRGWIAGNGKNRGRAPLGAKRKEPNERSVPKWFSDWYFRVHLALFIGLICSYLSWEAYSRFMCLRHLAFRRAAS